MSFLWQRRHRHRQHNNHNRHRFWRVALLFPLLCLCGFESQRRVLTSTQVLEDTLILPQNPIVTSSTRVLQEEKSKQLNAAKKLFGRQTKKKGTKKGQSKQKVPSKLEKKSEPLINDAPRNHLQRKDLQRRIGATEKLNKLFPGPQLFNNSDWGCQGDRVLDEIQIHIISWKRPDELEQLLQSLQTANYNGYNQEIPLFIHIDGGSSPKVNKLAKKFVWKHGPKNLDIRKQNVGLREMWLTSLRRAAPTSNHTLMLVLEDDMAVSPLYFKWLLQMIDHYARNPDCRDSNLVGFSLSPIVYQNMYKPFYEWSADEELRHFLGSKRHSAYLSTVPSSWGGAFWSDQWNQFDSFVQQRTKSTFYNTEAEQDPSPDPSVITPSYFHLPHECTTKTWTKSWKRFLVDFMYVRGLWMLYPNLPGKQGLAYAKQSSGLHVNEYNRDRYVVELVENVTLLNEMELELPSYQELMLIDLEHHVTSREIVMARGAQFLNRIATQCIDCQELFQTWVRPGWTWGNDNVPQICVADLYTTVAAQSLRPIPSLDAQRYLFVNAAIDLAMAEEWAALLNRTLLLRSNTTSPSMTNESSVPESLLSETTTHSSRVLTNASDATASTMDDLTLWNTTQLWRILRLHSPSYTRKSMMIPEVDLRHLFLKTKNVTKTKSVEMIQHMLGGCPDEVLILDGLMSILPVVEQTPHIQAPVSYHAFAMEQKKPLLSKQLPYSITKWSDLQDGQ